MKERTETPVLFCVLFRETVYNGIIRTKKESPYGTGDIL